MENRTDPGTEKKALLNRERGQWLALAAVALLLTMTVLAIAGEIGRARALQALRDQAANDAGLKAALLNATLERPRALPLVLSMDRDVLDALETRSVADIGRLDRRLEKLVDEAQASVIYVVGANGMAIASSNWRDPDSFVGNDYSFREYYQKAMIEGRAEHYALGSVSKRPGLYISRRVDSQTGKVLGVVVAKVEFDRLEQDWGNSSSAAYVVDNHDVVLITSIPQWRFMTTVPIDPARRDSISQSLQFGEAPLTPLPLKGDAADGLVDATMPGERSERYFRLILPVPTTEWQLHYLVPARATLVMFVRESYLMGLGIVAPILIFAAFFLRRRQQSLRNIETERSAREELERRVEARTRDLTLTRDRLQAEIAGHEQTERRLQDVQQDLVHANRLAILGQVAAGVAHEINQPVATIRTFADNARVLIDRGRMDDARDNLESIAGLTDRIGTITGDLKTLARKGRTAAVPTGIREVIEGAVVLLRSRFGKRMMALDIELPPEELMVNGTRVRLEQILINLLQNALEAIEGRSDGAVHVRVSEQDGELVAIAVTDNGGGMEPHIRDGLFTPFNTSKESGLGLGLVIARDIATDYGGRIEVESDTSGTCFRVYLKKA